MVRGVLTVLGAGSTAAVLPSKNGPPPVFTRYGLLNPRDPSLQTCNQLGELGDSR